MMAGWHTKAGHHVVHEITDNSGYGVKTGEDQRYLLEHISVKDIVHFILLSTNKRPLMSTDIVLRPGL